MACDPGLNLYRIGGGVSDQLLYTGAGRVMRVLVGRPGTTGAQFELNDSLDNSGSDILILGGIADQPIDLDFVDVGGIPFATGLWMDWTAGTGIKIWFEAA